MTTPEPFWRPLILALTPSVFQGLVAMAVSVVLGRFLGAHSFGVIAIYLAYVGVLSAVCALGLSQSSVYLIPKFNQAHQINHVRIFFLPAVILVVGVALICAWIWGEIIHVFLPRSLIRELIPWIFPVLVLSSLLNIFLGLLYSGHAAFLGALSGMLPNLVWLALCVLFHALVGSASIADYIVLYVGALLVVLVFQISELLRHFPRDVWLPTTWAPLRDVLSATSPFFQSNVWGVFGGWMGIIVAHWVVQESYIAYFVAAQKLIVDFLWKISRGMSSYTSAQVGQMSQDQPDLLRVLLARLARVMWGITGVYVIGALVFSEPLMGLWGAEFKRYWWLVWILAGVALGQTFGNILLPFLNAHAPQQGARIASIATPLILVFSLVGGYLEGIGGFASGIALAQFLQSFWLYTETRRVSTIGMRWVWGI